MQPFRNDYPMTPAWDLVKPSIALLKNNIWTAFYLLYLPALLLSLGGVMVENYTHGIQTDRQVAGLLIVIIGMIYTIISRPAAVVLELRASRGETPTAIECLKAGSRYILRMFAMNILMTVAIFFGFLLFIVPGLYLLRAFYLAQFYVVDQNLGPVQALKQSQRDSVTSSGYIWGLIGVAMIFSLGSGLLQIIPIAGTMLAIAVALLYRFADVLRYKEVHEYHSKSVIAKTAASTPTKK